MVIGIYIDVNGMVNEVCEDTPNIQLEQCQGFVQVNILERHANDEVEITESYVLHKVVNTLSELKS
jgi:hypothetical protein